MLSLLLHLVSVDARLLWAMDGVLQESLESAHKEVSKRALTVMLSEGKLAVHLQALRRYLLLGQGDFTRQLMENLEYVRLLFTISDLVIQFYFNS